MVATTWSGVRHERIGTWVHLLVTEPTLLDAAERELLAGLAELDAVASRFRGDSELSRACRADQPVAVSPLLAALVGCALDAAAETDGLVDPTLGRQLSDAGYDRTFAEVEVDGPASTRVPAPRADWRDVRLDVRHGDWWLHVPPGAQLDLGAIAKAWAADRLAAAVAQLGAGALVNLGGDLAVAGEVPPGGWPVELTDRPGGRPLQVVAVEGGGLATSSTTARNWRRGGVVVHHVLDPRTGRSATPTWASVSVAAETCLAANVAATAAVVLGEEAPAWLTSRGLAGLLSRSDGSTVRVGGWP